MAVKAKRKRKTKALSSELHLPLWAVVNGIKTFASELTYDQAIAKLKIFPDGTIVAKSVADRLKAV